MDSPTTRPRNAGDDASAKMDLDGDGVTVAEGDCDDRATSPMVPTDTGMVLLAKLRHPAKAAMSISAGVERCDGIDYNRDGIPDNAAQCDPFGDANVSIDIRSGLARQPEPADPSRSKMAKSKPTS